MSEIELPGSRRAGGAARQDVQPSRRPPHRHRARLRLLGVANALEDIVLNQQQSSDQWAFYQAKVIREHQYRAQKLILEAQAPDAGAARPRLEALAAKFGEEEKRYHAEKRDIENR